MPKSCIHFVSFGFAGGTFQNMDDTRVFGVFPNEGFTLFCCLMLLELSVCIHLLVAHCSVSFEGSILNATNPIDPHMVYPYIIRMAPMEWPVFDFWMCYQLPL